MKRFLRKLRNDNYGLGYNPRLRSDGIASPDTRDRNDIKGRHHEAPFLGAVMIPSYHLNPRNNQFVQSIDVE